MRRGFAVGKEMVAVRRKQGHVIFEVAVVRGESALAQYRLGRLFDGQLRTAARQDRRRVGGRERLEHGQVEVERRRKEHAIFLEAISPTLQVLVLAQVHFGEGVVGHDSSTGGRQQRYFFYADSDQLFDRRLDPAKAATFASNIEVKERREWYPQASQQFPEMLHMAAAQWNNGDESWINQESLGLGETRQDDPLRIPFAKDHEPREIEFRKSEHGAAHEFGGFLVVLWQLDRTDGRQPCLEIAPAIADFLGLNAAQHGGRMAGHDGLRHS